MNPAIKIDEDLPERLPPIFQRFGHVCRTVRQQGWAGLTDDELWPRVQANGEMLITADKGFGDLRKFIPGFHHGIVLLRTPQPSNVRYVALCERLLAEHALETLIGCLTVVTETEIRIRRND